MGQLGGPAGRPLGRASVTREQVAVDHDSGPAAQAAVRRVREAQAEEREAAEAAGLPGRTEG